MKIFIYTFLVLFLNNVLFSQRKHIVDLLADKLKIIQKGDSFYFLNQPINSISEYKKVMNTYWEDTYLNQIQNYLEADSLQTAFDLLKNMADSQFFFKEVIFENDSYWNKIKLNKEYPQIREKIKQNFNIFCEATQVKYPSIMRQLLWMLYVDQKYQYIQFFRNKYSFAYASNSNASIENLKNNTFVENKDSLDKYISQYGYLGPKEVGIMGADIVWVMVQHADFDFEFQKRMWSAMKIALKNDDCNPSNYALLTDRILVHENKKQRYGTQFHYVKKYQNGKVVQVHELWPIENTKHLDSLRKSMQLPPLKTYLQQMKNQME
ncbi:DUF6624 domain-containing protein [Rhizosphaericola mali]|uniref:Uncharacterized protein n=1 Tax=Rhizosphaericola mali TaxID=2545455 RepID=A0A5P2GBX6_9BACT|nr:DUF6624 domain-containing protein [Rhizosphaericola mali]QES90713.1 hypothetical protein E0W69_019330 [Rhizosphaericola mali]